ncbi:S16 family serine protease [Luxibacter massiliensis]|uniref:S16 family serine protease n=1 Tax=Luxibacter massiliensis TaxID=2219695 RepID=UPI002ED5C52C
MKDCIDQYLAVMQHTNENKGSALLLIGAPGTGQIILTGQIGDVMKGSACISLSLLKSRLPMNAVNFKEKDIHIHVPSGATPKDGPSAGITLFTALVSLITGKKVDSRLAMTGEITLRGEATTTSGLKEKALWRTVGWDYQGSDSKRQYK